jgi:hypothetical protein
MTPTPSATPAPTPTPSATPAPTPTPTASGTNQFTRVANLHGGRNNFLRKRLLGNI